ncbi:hypothetical protein Fmac_002428 [Flemingia macrophylla]|uniref:Integrase catalytic domain-containing protein n=1 Tax=Flemingia macrophylla TaxID=520843 RepID=A0ABD1NKP3_9FABA
MVKGTNEILVHGVIGADGLYSFPNLKLHQPFVLLSSSAEPCSDSAELSSSSKAIFNFNDVNKVSNVVLPPNSHSLWHSRLGHPNSYVLKLVLNHCKVPSSNNNVNEFCSSCCVGKSHRLPSSVSRTIYSAPLELIFTDMWGPSHISSHSGHVYYVSFIDAYSRFTWIYPLKSKVETLSVFQQFKAMVELQLNSKIKSVQSDWGGEFRPFTALLNNHGITHRSICPHTHHQNGVVERKHRHIVDLGLTLLHHASLLFAF